MSASLTLILGTRPEIIKLSPIIRECKNRDISYSLVHTGQHYSDNLDSVFFEQLELPQPDHNLAVGSGTHGQQTGKMIIELEEVLRKQQPNVVLVQGDTNSVLAGSIAASKLEGVEIGHVEAGLRSYDNNMPEEINRRLSDHVSDYHFAPTEKSRENLIEENIPSERITVTGNTIVDAVEQGIAIARERSTVLEDLSVSEPFALLTAHRAENVDDETAFVALLDGVSRAARNKGLSVVYPIHPRAQKRIDEFEITVPPEIKLVEPQDFLDFLFLEDTATLVFTDSGGVQEESCILQTPCVTLRDNTERPETIDVGANCLVGTDPETIVQGATEMITRDPDWTNPFGGGNAAERILMEVIDGQ